MNKILWIEFYKFDYSIKLEIFINDNVIIKFF